MLGARLSPGGDVNQGAEGVGALAERVAVVTGASKGIGQALAVGVARHGAAVAVNYKTDRKGAGETCRLIEEAGGSAVSIGVDVGSSSEARRLMEEAQASLGPVSLLVNNAGRTRFGPATEATDADWDDVMNTNLRGPFFASIAAAQQMIANDGGAIVNITSCAATLMIADHAIYTTSKRGLEAMTQQLALEFAPKVRVNAIAPAPTSGERNRQYDPNYDQNWGRVIPMGRVATPEDYVEPVVFLATSRSGFLTGEVLHVDGGWTLKGHTPAMDSYDFAVDRRRG
jgi:NAD(P)-dependent dehydrogenase (short-subunit alcohol dehydrogenase family)